VVINAILEPIWAIFRLPFLKEIYAQLSLFLVWGGVGVFGATVNVNSEYGVAPTFFTII